MGPLSGIKIIELAGIGPGPFCGMLLSDMGAEVIRVDRISKRKDRINDVLTRGRKSIALDLKSNDGKEVVLQLCESSDAIFEGFRPGVTERLGIGPDDCMARNERLVYGRMTGWGQEGPMAQAAGHDINYISLVGALHAIGEKDQKPVPPLNLVGDFGGGALYLAFGMVCALLEAKSSGKGQVVDAAMVDGAASLMSMFFSMRASGAFKADRGTNLLDGGAHFYGTYETSDRKYISLGSIEPKFYALLLKKTGVDVERFSDQMNPKKWEELREELEGVFRTKTRDEWCQIMEGSDVCFGPVLELGEVNNHPHNVYRKSFTELDGILQPAPAPRFSKSKTSIRNGSRIAGEDSVSILEAAGFNARQIEGLIDKEVVSQS